MDAVNKAADELRKVMSANVEEFCKTIDPTKYALCHKVDLDGKVSYWFEPLEAKKQMLIDAINEKRRKEIAELNSQLSKPVQEMDLDEMSKSKTRLGAFDECLELVEGIL